MLLTDFEPKDWPLKRITHLPSYYDCVCDGVRAVGPIALVKEALLLPLSTCRGLATTFADTV